MSKKEVMINVTLFCIAHIWLNCLKLSDSHLSSFIGPAITNVPLPLQYEDLSQVPAFFSETTTMTTKDSLVDFGIIRTIQYRIDLLWVKKVQLLWTNYIMYVLYSRLGLMKNSPVGSSSQVYTPWHLNTDPPGPAVHTASHKAHHSLSTQMGLHSLQTRKKKHELL